MKEFKPIKEGKVREVYDNGDSLIIAAEMLGAAMPICHNSNRKLVSDYRS